jgi:BCCT family betaine/carnitine transporter
MNKTIVTSSLFSILFSLLVFKDNSGVSSFLLQLSNDISYYLGSYYLVIGMIAFLTILYLGLSKYGDIRLGNTIEYSTKSWVAMIFTATMAADLIFFALHEWTYYYTETTTYLSHQSPELVASTYSLLHWGVIPWSFYILPAIVYAYYKYTKHTYCNNLSSALGISKGSYIIDSLGLIGLIAAVASTFSFTTPLIATLLNDILGLSLDLSSFSILIIMTVCVFYFSVVIIGGMNGIKKIANTNYFILIVGLVLVFINSSPTYIINTTVSSIGNLTQNFIGMSLFMSSSSFTRDWTIFYYAYWIAWSIATPFFIATISKGRTIRELALGGLSAGVLSTFLVFSVLTNAGLYYQSNLDLIGSIGTTDIYSFINYLIGCMSNSWSIKFVLIISMILLYVSTLDGILYVVSEYCNTSESSYNSKKSMIFWFIIFTILPISLIYNNQIMDVLKTLSIIMALPISIIVILFTIRFIKLIRKDNT